MFDQPVPIFSFLFKTRRTQSTNYPISDTIIIISQNCQCCQYSCPDPDSYPDILINRRLAVGWLLIISIAYKWISNRIFVRQMKFLSRISLTISFVALLMIPICSYQITNRLLDSGESLQLSSRSVTIISFA